MLPTYKLDTSNYKKLPKLVIAIKLKSGEFNPLENIIDYVSYGMCNILDLVADVVEQTRQARLLVHHQLQFSSLQLITFVSY